MTVSFLHSFIPSTIEPTEKNLIEENDDYDYDYDYDGLPKKHHLHTHTINKKLI